MIRRDLNPKILFQNLDWFEIKSILNLVSNVIVNICNPTEIIVWQKTGCLVFYLKVGKRKQKEPQSPREQSSPNGIFSKLT